MSDRSDDHSVAIRGELSDIRLKRRDLLRAGVLLGSGAIAGGLLAACGADDDEAPAAETPAGSSSTTTPAATHTPAQSTPTSEPSPAAAEVQPGGTLRLALAHEPDSLDPHFLLTTEAFRIVEQLYSTLVSLDKDINIVPDLAETWEINDDATNFEFNLRQGVRFHHGRELDANDVEYSAQRLADGSPYEYIFRDLDAITVADSHTIQFTFTRSAAHFLAAMAPRWTAIVAKEKVEEGGEAGLKNIASGTGPFKLVEWNPLQNVVIERNDEYFEQPYPYLDEIIWTPVEDETSRVNQVVSGTMDLDIDGPARLFDTYQSAPNIEVLEGPVVSFVYCGLNCARPPFDNVKARQAVAWAVDRQQIVDLAANGRGVPLLGGPIGPESMWAYNDFEAYPQPDPEKAKQLLEEAGVEPGTEVVLIAVSGTVFASIAQVLQQQLEPIGLTVKIEALEGGAANTRVFQDHDFDMAVRRWGTMIDPHDFTGEFFYSTGAYNFPQLKDPKLDEMLDQGVATPDQEKRKQIYAEIERYLALDVVPYVFLYRPTAYAAFTQRLQGLEHEAANTRISLRQVWFES